MKSIKILVLVGVLVGMLFAGCGKDEEVVTPVRDCEANGTCEMLITNTAENDYTVYYNNVFLCYIEAGEQKTLDVKAGNFMIKAVENTIWFPETYEGNTTALVCDFVTFSLSDK